MSPASSACSPAPLRCSRVEEEARSIETDIRKLTGKTDITQEEIDARAADIEARAKVAEELRRLDESIERGRADVDRLSIQLAEVQDAIDVLFTEGNAADEKEFIERAEIFKQRLLLFAELERLPVEIPSPGCCLTSRPMRKRSTKPSSRNFWKPNGAWWSRVTSRDVWPSASR